MLVPSAIASSPFTLEFLPKAIESLTESLKLIELPAAITLSAFLAYMLSPRTTELSLVTILLEPLTILLEPFTVFDSPFTKL